MCLRSGLLEGFMPFLCPFLVISALRPQPIRLACALAVNMMPIPCQQNSWRQQLWHCQVDVYEFTDFFNKLGYGDSLSRNQGLLCGNRCKRRPGADWFLQILVGTVCSCLHSRRGTNKDNRGEQVVELPFWVAFTQTLPFSLEKGAPRIFVLFIIWWSIVGFSFAVSCVTVGPFSPPRLGKRVGLRACHTQGRLGGAPIPFPPMSFQGFFIREEGEGKENITKKRVQQKKMCWRKKGCEARSRVGLCGERLAGTREKSEMPVSQESGRWAIGKLR